MNQEQQEDKGGDEVGLELVHLLLNSADYPPNDVGCKPEEDRHSCHNENLLSIDSDRTDLIFRKIEFVQVDGFSFLGIHETIEIDESVSHHLNGSSYLEDLYYLRRPLHVEVRCNDEHL